MRSILTYFIRYQRVPELVMFVTVVLGLLVFSNLRYAFFPSEQVRFIDVDVVFVGATPSEVEDGAIAKIEDRIKGVRGVDRFTSVSESGRGRISIELQERVSADDVLLDIQNAVDRITTFPDRMEPPVVTKREVLTLAMVLALSGEQPLSVIKDVAREIEADFLNSGRFSNIALSGYPDEEIEVALREADLRAYNLTFDEVARAVAAANVELFGGTLRTEREEIQIKADARVVDAGDLADLVIRGGEDGRQVRLGQVATLRNIFADRPSDRFLNGQQAVSMVIQNTGDEDILETVRFVRAYIDDFNEGREDLRITVIADQAEALEERLQLLTTNAWQGALLVLLVLAAFLNFRLALWVALMIPVSLLGMVIFAGIYGVTVNQLSMFGVILVLGILVDYGVVVSENIFQRFQRGETAYQAAIHGTLELTSPILISFATTVVAFALFFFLDGRLGEFFSDVSFVVVAANIAALAGAFILIPALVANSRSLREGARPNAIEAWLEQRFRDVIARIYAPLLRFSLRNGFAVVIGMVALFVLTMSGFANGVIRGTFFPNIEFDEIASELRLPAGTSEEVTAQILEQIEEGVWAVNARLAATEPDGEGPIRYVQRVVGPQANTGRLEIRLSKPEDRNLLAFDIAGLIREQVGPIPEAESLAFGPTAAFGKPISISITHRYNDLDQVREVKDLLREQMVANPIITDIIDTDELGLRELSLALRPEGVLLGLDLAGVLGQVRQGFFGAEVQSLQRGDEEVKVWVRYPRGERATVDQLERTRILGPDGQRYFLQDIAQIEEVESVIAINRRDGLREITIEADLASLATSVPEVVGRLQREVIAPLQATYPDLAFSFEGQSRESERTAGSAQRAGPIILLLIVFLILMNSRSFSQLFLTLLLIPFSIIGVAWGHVIQGIPLSIFSFLGVIALIGILVNNILVFLSTYNDNLRRGQQVAPAIYRAALSRFKPILLTAVTTAAGLLPLLLGTSIGAQFLKPTAVSVFYGLLFATFLTLGFLPVLILYSNRMKHILLSRFRPGSVTPESVETAVMEEAHLRRLRSEGAS